MTVHAQALEFAAPRVVQIKQVELPRVGPTDVLVRTLYSGISGGTEILAYRGEIDPDLPLDEKIPALGGSFEFPFRYGYSCVGRVEQTSPEGPPEGSLVFSLHPHQDVFVCRARDALCIEGIDPRLGTLLPIVETALQISLDAGPCAHETVIVVGLGAVGILTAALLAREGARVVGLEPRSWRRRAAEAFGIESTTPDQAADLIGDEGAALLVEVSGNPKALAHGLAFLAHEGTALVGSWYGSRAVSLPLGRDFHRRRLTIKSSQVSTIPAALTPRWSFDRRREVARRLLEELPLKGVATHEFPFEDAARAYEEIDNGAEGLIHAALRYEAP